LEDPVLVTVPLPIADINQVANIETCVKCIIVDRRRAVDAGHPVDHAAAWQLRESAVTGGGGVQLERAGTKTGFTCLYTDDAGRRNGYRVPDIGTLVQCTHAAGRSTNTRYLGL